MGSFTSLQADFLRKELKQTDIKEVLFRHVMSVDGCTPGQSLICSSRHGSAQLIMIMIKGFMKSFRFHNDTQTFVLLHLRGTSWKQTIRSPSHESILPQIVSLSVTSKHISSLKMS